MELLITLYKVVLTLEFVTIQMKATVHYFPMMLFIKPQGSTVRKESWGKLASTFSILVTRTSILVAINYLQEKIEYNVLKVF